MDISKKYRVNFALRAPSSSEVLEVVPGLVFCAVVAVFVIWLSSSQFISGLGLGALPLAILIGILVGNALLPFSDLKLTKGIDFSKTFLLRLGIILYGFRITFQEFAVVGWSGLWIAGFIVCATFILSIYLGRILKIDPHTSALIGVGSAICGAAAILAAAPVLRASAEKVSIAVATIVVFGTASMFIYPLIYPYLGMSEQSYGVFVGSTIHEVAQVVVAGAAVGEQAASIAVVEKMVRVMMLAPFLIFLSRYATIFGGSSHLAGKGFSIPWFAVLFIVVVGINSIDLFSDSSVQLIVALDSFLLTMAMVALGLRTSIRAIHEAGKRPLLAGFLLAIFLISGGYALNVLLAG